jgi:polysaccharide export outer membrane protein
MEGHGMRRYISEMIRSRLLVAALCVVATLAGQRALPADAPITIAVPQPAASQKVQLGVGDQVRIDFFGLPEMAAVTTVGEDGVIRLPLLPNPVKVIGMSPTEAAKAIESEYLREELLVDPHAQLTVVSSSSQRVSVVGEVRAPGRYPIESNTTVLDLIALAGGLTDKASDVVAILRPDAGGKTQSIEVDTRALLTSAGKGVVNIQEVHGGDSIVVPKATFMINGEVKQPGEYRIESGMTVSQAVAKAGGVTPLGSESRISIERRPAGGKVVVIKKAKRDMHVETGDIIKVGERLF